ncbi:MAG: S41 family peptidase [Candidatus Omnitrophota bacterium]
MRRRFIIIAVVLTIAISSYKIGISFSNDKDDLYRDLEIFAEGLAVIEGKYVEEKNPEDLVYGAMRGLASSLDAYSQFLTPDDYKNLLVETEGKFGGLGIEITLRNSLLTIISPIEDTPAWRAGIEAGDIIIKIDGESTKDITLNEAVKQLRGDPETEVILTVFREGNGLVEDITIVRDIIKIKDIKRSLILEDGVGYIKIGEFRESTYKDLCKALEELEEEGLKALVIDVRNNPGGLLNSAIDISSKFLDDGTTVVSTDSRNEDERIYKTAPFRKKYIDIPIVVLINKGSASGSEILAAALRDNNRAILVGEATFGKGSVQTILPLSDGSAMRLTTSKYYTPAGISIHEKGIEPDIKMVKEVIEKSKDDVFKELDRKQDFDYKKDSQIVRALDLIKGILILRR